jgi:hypothetical protein
VTLIDPGRPGPPQPDGERPPLLDGPYAAPPSEPSRLTRMLCATGAVGACTAGLAFVYAVNPNVENNPYPRCLLKAMTGIDCPGCGGTRAMYSLLHGDIAGAADHNILVFAIVPLVAYMLVAFVLKQFGHTIPLPRASRTMGWAVAAFLLVFSVARNLPFGPLSYLGSATA